LTQPTHVQNVTTVLQPFQLFLQGSLGDRPTDRATRSLAIGSIYVRSSVMCSNNNCSISRLLDWFPCFYHWKEQGNHRQQTSLCHSVESQADFLDL